MFRIRHTSISAMKSYQLAVYVPLTHVEVVRKALAENNAGAVGNYDSCSFTTVGVGRSP